MMTTRFKASQFRMEMERAFTNRTFLFCVAAIAFLFVYPVLQEWQYGFPRETGFMYYYRYSHRLSRFREVSLILSALPYVASFCVDWNSGYIKSEIIRGNHKRYAISKYITVGISSYATLFLGIIGFAAFLALTTPINANMILFTI